MKTIKVKSFNDVPKNYSGIAVWYDKTKIHFKNGKYHRLDGAAFESWDSTKEYWINGRFVCRNTEQYFYNSKEYKIAKQQEDLLNNFKRIKNI